MHTNQFFFLNSLIQGEVCRKKIMGKVLLSGNGSAFGSIGCESHVLILYPESYRRQDWKRDVKGNTVHFPHLTFSDLSQG